MKGILITAFFVLSLVIITTGADEKCHLKRTDLIFMLDGSSSISKIEFATVKDVLVATLDVFQTIGPIGVQIGVIQFSSTVQLEVDMHHANKETMKITIRNIQKLNEGTNTGAALDFVATQAFTEEKGARMDADVEKVLVVITDGIADDNITISQQKVKSLGVEVFVIAIGNFTLFDFAKLLASKPTRDHVTVLHDYKGIESALLSMQKKLCVVKPGICDGPRRAIMDEYCFQCLSHQDVVIVRSSICDGAFNCPDLSDECLCSPQSRPKICEKMILGDNAVNGNENRPYCLSANGTYTAIDAAIICQNETDCINNEDAASYKSGCGSTSTNDLPTKSKDFICFNGTSTINATACDGIPECSNILSEECECETKAEFCNYFTTYKNTTGYPGCVPVNATVVNLVSLNEMCDGLQFCENFADERGCVKNFYCSEDPLPNISSHYRCNRRDDCQNKADERNCSLFRCNDTGLLEYIHEDAVCDGIQDCKSGSDECQRGCIRSAFSDEDNFITDKRIFAIAWIISIAATVGCTTVIVLTFRAMRKRKTLRSRQSVSGHTTLINIMLLSLAVSDLLVGVYTLVICIKASNLDVRYCQVDREWRSSTTCSTLGVIMVIGSEQSVLTMLLIAIYRLRAVVRPFARPELRRAIVAILGAWVISILLAVIPVIPSMEDTFKSSVGFSANDIFKVVAIKEVPYTINWLNLMHNATSRTEHYGTTNWKYLKNLISEMNPNITVIYEFGYYASHSVCLPAFFPEPKESKAWGYSTGILLINFFAFVCMLAIYVLLYRHATKNKGKLVRMCSEEKKITKHNENLQRKLTRILISDFLCWMPICIMGLLNLFGVRIPKDAYLPSGLLIVPINSALNPLLYSDLPEIICGRMKIIKSSISSSISTTQSEHISLHDKTTSPDSNVLM